MIEWGRGAQTQRPRIVDSQERAQRALIGTIEASIKAVGQAEEEMAKQPHIDIPKFDDDPKSRQWHEKRVAVEKENVGERLAAMGAATAQVRFLLSPSVVRSSNGQRRTKWTSAWALP